MSLAARANPGVAFIDLIAFVGRQRQDFEAEGVNARARFGPRYNIALQAREMWWVPSGELLPKSRRLGMWRCADLRLPSMWAASRHGCPFLGFDGMALLARAREVVGGYQQNSGTGFCSNLERAMGGTACELN